MNPRDRINERLADLGRSRYWLAKRLADRGVCNAETVYRYLRGDHDTTTAVLAAMLDELELEIG